MAIIRVSDVPKFSTQIEEAAPEPVKEQAPKRRPSKKKESEESTSDEE